MCLRSCARRPRSRCRRIWRSSRTRVGRASASWWSKELPMPSRRDLIKMTDAEQAELLDSERIVIGSSLGPRGWPHSMPMWFLVRDGEIWVWTYAKSQKVRNLERDPRATLLVETGMEYTELRGIQIEAEAELIR